MIVDAIYDTFKDKYPELEFSLDKSLSWTRLDVKKAQERMSLWFYPERVSAWTRPYFYSYNDPELLNKLYEILDKFVKELV